MQNNDEDFAPLEVPDLEMGMPYEEITTFEVQDAEMRSEDPKPDPAAPTTAFRLVQVKDTIRPCLVDDIAESQQNSFEDYNVDMAAF
jgi:hypothetical protein